MPVLNVGDRMPEVMLRRATGEPVALSEFTDRPLLVLALRYYGCLPCREFLSQLRPAYPKVEALGARAIAVGTAADYQAQALMDDGLPFPALVDPESNLYRAAGIRRLSWWEFFKPGWMRMYWRAFRRGGRQAKITGDWLQLPGLLILDGDGVVRWLYRGKSIGDYPPLDDVLRRLTDVAA